MNRNSARSSEVLLARLNHRVEKISEVQHRLARKRTLLQEQITRLRLGVSPTLVRVALQASSLVDREARRRWDTDWPALATRVRTDRDLVGAETR